MSEDIPEYIKGDEKPKCGACLFFMEGEPDPNNVAQRSYFCKRYPPIIIPMPAQQGIALHSMSPIVTAENYCGEFEPVDDPDIEPANEIDGEVVKEAG